MAKQSTDTRTELTQRLEGKKLSPEMKAKIEEELARLEYTDQSNS